MGQLEKLVEKQYPEKSILALLQVQFNDQNDPELFTRAELLKKIFSEIEVTEATSLYSRLTNQNSKERITYLFHRKLSSQLSVTLLKILKEKIDNTRAVSTPIINKSLVYFAPFSNNSGFTQLKPFGDRSNIKYDGNPIFVQDKKLTGYRDDIFDEDLRNKITNSFNRENSRIKSLAKEQMNLIVSGTASKIIPGSHEWDLIDNRLLFLRYYFEAYHNARSIRISSSELSRMIFDEEKKFQKYRGIKYDEPFPSKDFSARYGNTNSLATNQRDFRCGTSHHRFASPPDPVKFEREPTTREIFEYILKQMHLTEEQYKNLNAQILGEKFTDDEINFIFSHAYIYTQYLIEKNKTTLREYIANWQKYQAYIKKYGDPNEAYTRFVKINPNRIQSTIFRASQNEAVKVAYEVLKKLKEVYKKIAPVLSLICDFIPYVGPIKALIEATAGVDIITGDELAGWQRALAILPLGIKHSGAIVKGVTQVAKSAAKIANGPQALLILTLACKSGRHPVEIIENMKAVATMSENVIAAADKEAKLAKQGKVLKVTETQAEAIKEVRKAAEKLKPKSAIHLPSAKQVASNIKPVVIPVKHSSDQSMTSNTTIEDRTNKNRITTHDKKSSKSKDDTPALPPKDKKSTPKSRRKQVWFRVPDRGVRIFNSLYRLSRKGYQVYVYKNKDGIVLYVGKSGGAGGKKPMHWLDRLRRDHILEPNKTEWIGEVDKISVRAGLTEMEAFALEERLIKQTWKTNRNLIEGEFTKRFGAGDLPANYESALKKPEYHFEVDIVN